MRTRNRKPTHAGKVFKLDVLEPLGITVTRCAEHLGVSRKHLSLFVNERVPCSVDLAKRIAIATDTSMESWLNMQQACDVWAASQSTDDLHIELLQHA